MKKKKPNSSTDKKKRVLKALAESKPVKGKKLSQKMIVKKTSLKSKKSTKVVLKAKKTKAKDAASKAKKAKAMDVASKAKKTKAMDTVSKVKKTKAKDVASKMKKVKPKGVASKKSKTVERALKAKKSKAKTSLRKTSKEVDLTPSKNKKTEKSKKSGTKTFAKGRALKKTTSSKSQQVSHKTGFGAKKAQKHQEESHSIASDTKKTQSLEKDVHLDAKPKETVGDKKTTFIHSLEQELERILNKNQKIAIKGSEGYEYCLEENCDQAATTAGFCRYHYIVCWHDIKTKAQILSDNQLETDIQNLIRSHSVRLLEYMLRDFSNEDDFTSALEEMKIVEKKPDSSAY